MANIKSAIELYSNEDSTMSLVRAFEKNAVHQGHQLLVKGLENLQRNWKSPLECWSL